MPSSGLCPPSGGDRLEIQDEKQRLYIFYSLQERFFSLKTHFFLKTFQ